MHIVTCLRINITNRHNMNISFSLRIFTAALLSMRRTALSIVAQRAPALAAQPLLRPSALACNA
jgi:hypothetical protein